ncbi:MAG: hypothetical protein ACKOCH_00015, partial [Bacteroidota bacterium]
MNKVGRTKKKMYFMCSSEYLCRLSEKTCSLWSSPSAAAQSSDLTPNKQEKRTGFAPDSPINEPVQ